MQHLFEKYKPHNVYYTAAYKYAPMVEDKASEALETDVLGAKAIVDLGQ